MHRYTQCEKKACKNSDNETIQLNFNTIKFYVSQCRIIIKEPASGIGEKTVFL